MATVAERQPDASVSWAMIGRKMSWPVAAPAARTPETVARRFSNHRLLTVATSDIDMTPAPRPMSAPQHAMSCHGCVIHTGSTAPAAMRASAATTTARTPKRSMAAAENGAVRP
ncbi:hypothetical protein DEAB109302_07280 [Dermacoccus abyssi]